MISTLQNIWEKNWPEAHAALTGSLPEFILARHPSELGSDVPVFCYHIMDAEEFEAGLEYLARNGYVTLDGDGLLDHLQKRRPAPERAVVLTIDDGARNLYEVIYPLLQRYNMKAVAFIAPRFHTQETDCSSLDSNTTQLRPLSWSQIREMHSFGAVDIQSHTYEHRYIPRWPEPWDLQGSDSELVRSLRGPEMTIEEDLLISKEILEQKLNKKIRHLAFPRYKGTEEALRIGRACGYEAFWWGVLPYHDGNKPGQSPSHVVRVSSEFLRRLPGDNREPLSRILRKRLGANASRLLHSFGFHFRQG